MSGAAGWLRATVGAAARIAPGPTARCAHHLFRRPAVARRFDRGDRALLSQASAIMARGEEIRAATPEGPVRAFRFRPVGGSRGGALLLHGWTADARAMGAFVEPLRAAGFDVLIPDLPAHGASAGRETDAPACARAVAALMAEIGFAPECVVAHSFGGGVLGMLARDGIVPRRAVSIASPSRLRCVTDDFCAAFGLTGPAKARFEALMEARSGHAIDDLDGLKIWPGLPAEILILHAPDDEEVDFAEAERLSTLPQARLRAMPGFGHRRIVYDEASVAAVAGFLAGGAGAD